MWSVDARMSIESHNDSSDFEKRESVLIDQEDTRRGHSVWRRGPDKNPVIHELHIGINHL